MRVRIGTRGSELALLQARSVAEQIESVQSDVYTELVEIETSGDRGRGGKGPGMFVKEVNRAVAEGEVDIGVHSLKDLPTDIPTELSLACVPERLSPNDVLVSPSGNDIHSLPSGSIIGTGSLRRKAEISAQRSDLEFEKIRGNVDTRIGKVEGGEYDALITSMAALERLGLTEKAVQEFEFEEVVPAAGQGSLGVVKRTGDGNVDFLNSIYDEDFHREAICERAYLKELGLGCRAGAGIIARVKDAEIKSLAVLHDSEGRRLVKLRGKDPAELGRRAASEVRK